MHIQYVYRYTILTLTHHVCFVVVESYVQYIIFFVSISCSMREHPRT